MLLCPHAGDVYGKALVDSVLTSVKGGTLESAVAMRAKLNKEGVMDIGTYQNWARTIADAPALINSEVKTMDTEQDSVSSLKLQTHKLATIQMLGKKMI